MGRKVDSYNKALKKGLGTRHVVRRGDEWIVKKPLSRRASAVVNTQKEAISTAKQMSRNDNSRVIIHGMDGRIKKIF